MSLVDPLVSSLVLTLKLSTAHTAQPIHKDSLVLSHVITYTYTSAPRVEFAGLRTAT